MPRLLTIILLFTFLSTHAQWLTVSGTVYDISRKFPVESVSVLSTSGAGTMTDSAGHYAITLRETDSIYFSFLNKATPKYPVNRIANMSAFDISIMRKIGELPLVTVRQRNYRMDSLQNRIDYTDVFNYKKPGIRPSIGDGGVVGLDVDAFIKMFQFKRNKRMVAFQRRLLKEEEDRFINHRFNKGLVKRLTGLNAPEIDTFMAGYRPTLVMVQQFNDLELGQYIVEAFKFYKAGVKVDRSVLERFLKPWEDY